MPLNLVDTS